MCRCEYRLGRRATVTGRREEVFVWGGPVLECDTSHVSGAHARAAADRCWVEDANVEFVPLHSDQASDPAWGQAVVGGFDFDTTVQMHDPLAVLVIAKRFQGQREQGGFFFGKHGGDLPFGGAVNASIGAAGLPMV